jgi:hypothetical protein
MYCIKIDKGLSDKKVVEMALWREAIEEQEKTNEQIRE